MSEAHPSPTVRSGVVHAGVVLRLPEPTGRELQNWRASFEDQSADAVAPHITLMITELDRPWDELADRVRQALAQQDPFHVEVNGTGTFRPLTPVVYLRIERGREQCTALHAALARHGLVSASPFDYHPHVTLAHGTDDAALDRAQEMLRTYRAGFLVDRVHLYEGDAQGHWHPRQSLALGARTANEHGAH